MWVLDRNAYGAGLCREGFAVRAEHYTEHLACVAIEGAKQPAAAHFPQTHRRIPTAGGDPVVVGAEGHAVHLSRMA